MLSNRRNPGSLTPFMPQNYPGKQNIDKVCKCKSIEALCQLWDVDATAVGKSVSIPSESTTLHRYDDRYFLDPETLHKEREEEENLKIGSNRVRKTIDSNNGEEKKIDGHKDEIQSKKQRLNDDK